MDKESFAGAVKEATGAVKEALGNALGDAKLKEAGRLEMAAGKAEKAAGKPVHEAKRPDHAASHLNPATGTLELAAGAWEPAAKVDPHEAEAVSSNFSASAKLGLPLLADDPSPLSKALIKPEKPEEQPKTIALL